jgi:hypothetical protein
MREIAADIIKESDIHRTPRFIVGGGGGKYKIVRGKRKESNRRFTLLSTIDD